MIMVYPIVKPPLNSKSKNNTLTNFCYPIQKNFLKLLNYKYTIYFSRHTCHLACPVPTSLSISARPDLLTPHCELSTTITQLKLRQRYITLIIWIWDLIGQRGLLSSRASKRGVTHADRLGLLRNPRQTLTRRIELAAAWYCHALLMQFGIQGLAI